MREFELIDELAARIRDAGVAGGERVVLGTGDDAAVTIPPGPAVTSVDMAVEGVHFRRETSSLLQAGRKALASALSDLAAMGASPGEAYVALGVPNDLEREGAMALLDGLVEVASETGTALVGGDVSAAPAITLAVSVVGYVEAAEQAVGRAGAEPGHVVCVTGELGAAAAGLVVSERPGLEVSLDPGVRAELLRRLRDPRPRLAAGAALARSGAAAMIDVSDGLGADAGHVARASDAYLTIELGRVPISPGVDEVAEAMGRDGLDFAAAGGEDYELLATLPPGRLAGAAEAVRATGTELTAIGEVTDGCGVELRATDGSVRPARGFEQRRGTR